MDRDEHRYDDIIDLPRPASSRPRMPMADRAARFAPFAALNGFDDVLVRAARPLERRAEPGEAERAELDARLRALLRHVAQRPEVTVTCFIPEEGGMGRRETLAGPVRRISPETGELILANGRVIPFGDILALEGPLFDEPGS